MPRTVVLLASGTRGDLYPYLALGRGLQMAGVRAVVATHAEFRALVDAAGLPFALLDGNPSDWMVQPGGQSALTYDGNLVRSARATLAYLRAVRPLFKQLLESAWKATAGADLLVAGLATLWGAHLAEARQVPCVWGFLQPMTRTRAFPSALLPFRFSMGRRYNALTHRLVEQAMWQPWRSMINAWRIRTLGLRPAPFLGPFDSLANAWALLAVSPSVLPRPTDWPATHIFTGYWFLDQGQGWRPSQDLERFLEAGPAVSIGFGSPGVRAVQATLATVTQALRLADLRAVLAVPSGGEPGGDWPKWILPIARVPHTWLFPRVAAAVHHGGAGTTAASLCAGTPTLILPLAIDQFFWGERVAALGAGPRPQPQRSLTAEALARALRAAVDDNRMRARAQSLGAAIRSEDGLARAVEIIRARL